ncbi:MarR family transcriptional regulator [Streptomyces sp. NPDC051940]|uniref:MarR family winged helix-turn-helix transcriptional regulator n=1 Tax=Streptomyces sp. NPDC051940 TaxID=3155675 RepID=UPI00343717EE
MTAADRPATDAVDVITAQWREVNPGLDVSSMEVLARVFRIGDTVGARMTRAYGRYGLSRGEFDALSALRRAGEPYTLSPRELAAATLLTTGGMTGRLDKLERAGLLTRSPDPNDRRGLRVTLTERGLELTDEAAEAGLRVQREALAGLTPQQAAQLAALLRALVTSSERTG